MSRERTKKNTEREREESRRCWGSLRWGAFAQCYLWSILTAFTEIFKSEIRVVEVEQDSVSVGVGVGLWPHELMNITSTCPDTPSESFVCLGKWMLWLKTWWWACWISYDEILHYFSTTDSRYEWYRTSLGFWSEIHAWPEMVISWESSKDCDHLPLNQRGPTLCVLDLVLNVLYHLHTLIDDDGFKPASSGDRWWVIRNRDMYFKHLTACLLYPG